VPPRGIVVRRYQPDDLRTFATIRLSYPKISPQSRRPPAACGRRTSDPRSGIRATSKNKSYFQFRLRLSAQPWRQWSKTPLTLVQQPRSETPAYTAAGARRLFEKYRKGYRDPRPPYPRSPTRRNSAIQANEQLRAQESGKEQPAGTPVAGGRSHRPPAPRVVGAGVLRDGGNRRPPVQSAAEDRRLGKAHLRVEMGGNGGPPSRPIIRLPLQT